MEDGVESEGLDGREVIGGGFRWPYEGDGTKVRISVPLSDSYFQLYYEQDEIKLFLIMNLFIFIAQHKYSANALIIFKNNLRLKKS